MPVRVEFHGGPGDGAVRDYPFQSALPSLVWSQQEPEYVAAVYHRDSDAPDPDTGAWRYTITR